VSLSPKQIKDLRSLVNVNQISDPQNVRVLGHLTRIDREQFARETGTMVLYFGEEVPEVMRIEEAAALKAAPRGHDLSLLQGLNMGSGNRTISPYLLPIDIMRHQEHGSESGEHGALHSGAFLALSDDLPFKPNSVDYIVALHMLEHVEDPVEVVLHWLAVIKPGGGIGVVVPDWRYTWDARHDDSSYGHKWNATPDLVRLLYAEHWSNVAELEHIDTYDHKISFDFVLRKPGEFKPFAPPRLVSMKSGKQRNEMGLFLSGR
jgi:SAM-dependent methyltransferase